MLLPKEINSTCGGIIGIPLSFDSYLSPRIVQKSGLPLITKMSSVIADGNWCWPSARTDHMVAIQAAVCRLNPM